MTDKTKIAELVNEKLGDKAFLVDVKVSPSNVIKVFVDSYEGITIKECSEISRYLEGVLDRDEKDFELQVSSPGLTESFKVKEQYLKNRGREVEIITVSSSDKYRGVLKETDNDYILLESKTREKVEGHKKKQLIVREHQIKYSDIKSAKVVISFK